MSDREILEYKSIQCVSYKITDLVNQAIQDGFQPFGPPGVTFDDYEYVVQTMVKYAPSPVLEPYDTFTACESCHAGAITRVSYNYPAPKTQDAKGGDE
jgi:hypothetical protein